jgi:hypothetical protein
MQLPHELFAACEKTVGVLVGADVGAPTPDFHALSEILSRTDHINEKPRFHWVFPIKTGFKNGSGGRIRTCDQLVNRRMSEPH